MSANHNIEDVFPLSSLQEGILFHSLYSPGEGVYVDHIVCHLRATGQIDAAALGAAFQFVVDRHQALRTAFVWKLNSKPQQVVLRKVVVPMNEHDWSGVAEAERDRRLGEFMKEARAGGFDLSKPPLLRLDLFHCGPGFAKLAVTYHHITMDAWSGPIVLAELQKSYQSLLQGLAPQMAAPRPFRDYIHWQRRCDLGPAETFWRNELKGLSAPTMLLSERSGKIGASQGAEYVDALTELSAPVSDALRAVARQQALTLNTLLQCAWAFLLGRCANSDDVLFGTVVAGRPHELLGIESMVGLFTNSLPMRVRMAPRLKVGEWLQTIQKKQFELHEYEWSPLAKIQEWSEFDRNVPMFESVVIFQNVPVSSRTDGERQALEISVALHDPKNNFPLTLMVIPAGRLSLRLLYDRRRFAPETIERSLDRLAALLGRIPAALDRPLHSLSVLTDSERRELANGRHDAEFPADRCLHELFERRALEMPDAMAAVFGDSCLTYGELNRHANAVAATLLDRCESEEIVAIAAERGLSFLIAMLAVFKAGCAYLPIDPKHPPSRIAQILRLSGSSLVLAAGGQVAELRAACRQPDSAIDAQILDLDEQILRAGGEENVSRPCGLRNLAYVIYTSGSTGVPKGAMIEHGGMLNHLYAKIADLHLAAKDVVAQTASQCFDISVWQFLSPLLAGGRVEIFPDEITHNPALLLRETLSKGITVLETVPSMLRALLNEESQNLPERPLARLSFMVVTGEELLADLARRWFREYPDVPLVNAYGPTECSDDITHHFIHESPEASERVPIGRCLANMRLYVLDYWMERAPIGVMGELFAGGAGVGRGYLNDPVRTAESFVPDPFFGPGSRLYRTGDQVCQRADGSFDFFGRIDSQLKIRGFRIELGEIESLVSAHPAVQQAVVLARKTREAAGLLRLSAYIVPDPGYRPENPDAPDYQLERTGQWKAVFDEVYGEKNTSESDSSLHTRVWVNTYTGRPFPEEEIFESVEDSVARIKSLRPRRVLELGCGTGLLLFRLAPFCEGYWAADISPQALNSIDRRRGEMGSCDVRLFERPAHDFSGFMQEQFDLIILNEIVQYFPDGEYLFDVLAQAIVAVRPGGSVFVGGVRNLHLLRAFHSSVELFRSPGDLSLQELRARIQLRSDQEKELLVAPEFFAALQTRFPQIQAARIVPKGGRSGNEFTKFRYDAILRVDSASPEDRSWMKVPWEETGGTPDSLVRWLLENKPQQAVITGIPNAHTAADVESCRLLFSGVSCASVDELRRLLSDASKEQVSMDPNRIQKAMEDTGFFAEVSWAATDAQGAYDLLLRQSESDLWQMACLNRQQIAWTSARSFTNLLRRPFAPADLIAEVRKHVRQNLPDYMVPSDFVVMQTLPLTANGKADHQALLKIEVAAASAVPDVVPPTATEELIITIWSGLLGAGITRHSDFFEFGGHSLLATQVMSRLKKAFQVELPLRALFDAPTVSQFARVVDAAARQSRGIVVPPIVPAPAEGRRVLSYAQQRLWIMDQMEPGTPAYNLPNALRIEGRLQIAALQAAFNETIRRHESLRTTFRMIAEQPQQFVGVPFRIKPAIADLSGISAETRETEITRLALEEGRKPFDIHSGPLLREFILRTGPNSHVILFTMHHIISDAWSAGILVSELAALYGAYAAGDASPLPQLPVQYADFAYWQRQWMQGDALVRQLTYWKQQLAGAPASLNLPLDFPRPQVPGPEGRSHVFQLSPVASRQLQDLARKESATIFMATLAVFKILLYQVTGQKDIVVGTDIANRNQAETERLIGFFVNLLVLRTKISGGLTFRKLLDRVREVAMEAFTHQDLPFDILTREMRIDRPADNTPLFDVLFVFQNAAVQGSAVSGVSIRPLLLDYNTARFDLALFMEESSQGLMGKWIYRTRLFSHTTIARLSGRFEALLNTVAADPDRLIDELSISRMEQPEQERPPAGQTVKKLKAVRPKAVSLVN